ncbi:rhodanese-like domain-containing protein [Modestobacter sp. Leaf380]|uniref:rhodanese-like domain-containing protein n=1 Tax=Modestobacter sp. Leaf380 TaxID=1736356 RepID=UPI0007007769|nr:rhodanese-like domain-containing protein [Modestobacter sp. Leaf380]KQS66953.1 sulfurtransferase [Modestobacter sp. Leaf380]
MDWSTDPTVAAAYFAHRLTVETDVSDVHAALESGDPGFVLVDVRSREAWDQGHVPGAVHAPVGDLVTDGPVVVHCWGPGCNGATRAGLRLAARGVRVREMLGGFEYWAREGFAVQTADGVHHPTADPLTAPAGAVCGC